MSRRNKHVANKTSSHTVSGFLFFSCFLFFFNLSCFQLLGKALRNLGDLERSREALLKARRESPSDSCIAKELEALDKAMQRQQIQERIM